MKVISKIKGYFSKEQRLNRKYKSIINYLKNTEKQGYKYGRVNINTDVEIIERLRKEGYSIEIRDKNIDRMEQIGKLIYIGGASVSFTIDEEAERYYRVSVEKGE